MIKEIYTLRDNKVEVYNQPFYGFNREQVERDMLLIANDEQQSLSARAEDYALYYLGTFDDQTGKHDFVDAPEHVLNLIDLKKG